MGCGDYVTRVWLCDLLTAMPDRREELFAGRAEICPAFAMAQKPLEWRALFGAIWASFVWATLRGFLSGTATREFRLTSRG